MSAYAVHVFPQMAQMTPMNATGLPPCLFSYLCHLRHLWTTPPPTGGGWGQNEQPRPEMFRTGLLGKPMSYWPEK